MTQRHDEPEEGALVMVTHRGRGGRIRSFKDVIERVSPNGPGVNVRLADGGVLTYEPGSDDFGELGRNGRTSEVYEVRLVVPPSQVRRPGVSAGDTVKLGTGSTAYRVERVEDGMVSLADGRTVPVTRVTAFDEDVDDFDPFEIIPGGVSDLFRGDD